MDRANKQDFVADLRQSVKDAALLVLVKQDGLTVAEVSDLRQQMRQADARLKVVKNTLARLALEGTPFECVSADLMGPVAFAYSVDPVAAAKVVVKFSKDNEKLSVISGALGEKKLSSAEVTALSKLPSLDEMRAKILGVISAPARNMVSVVNAPATQLTQVISAYAQK